MPGLAPSARMLRAVASASARAAFDKSGVRTAALVSGAPLLAALCVAALALDFR
jgi:hypothetical protein